MKKQTALIMMAVALAIGAGSGVFGSSQLWSRNVEFQTTTSALHDVTMLYVPLKLLKAGQTKEAIQALQAEMGTALSSLQSVSEELNRPDLLTNAAVVGAKMLR